MSWVRPNWSATVDDKVVDHVPVSGRDTTSAALSNTSLDEFALNSHNPRQEALGETGGTPILRIEGDTSFGRLLTALPAQNASWALFDAVAALARTPQFTQLQRPRNVA